MDIDANTIMLKATPLPTAAQLWRVVNSFHMGEFLKTLMEQRHINVSSLAEAMGIKPQSFPSYYRSAVIKDEVLIKMTNALGWDLFGLIKQEQARRMVGPRIGEKQSSTDANLPMASDAAVEYRRRPPSAPDTGLVLMINLDEYAEDSQLRILRVLQQEPRRSRSATGN